MFRKIGLDLAMFNQYVLHFPLYLLMVFSLLSQIGYHKEYEDSRCFMLVRSDGTVEDFSYRKCMQHALELIAPQKAKTSKWLNGASA